MTGRLAFLLVIAALAAAQSTPQYDIVTAKKVMVPMRDGARLSTDIYFPARNGVPVPGKFPVILERTPYGSHTIESWASYFVPRGYIAIGQNVRGRYGSEGEWFPHRDDVRDGYDTAEWVGKQPWFSGKIGTVGTSYPGGTQHALAMGNPPYLAAMVPVDSMSNPGLYGVRHHGAFELRFFNWIFSLGNSPSGGYGPTVPQHYPTSDPATRAALADLRNHVIEYIKALPLRPGTTPLRFAPEYESWLIEAMSHGDYDEFWKNCGSDVVSHIAEYKDIPVYHVSGWYDSWGLQVANLNYVELARAKKSPQRLIMGPWTHGGQTASFAGEAEFGPDAAIDFNALRLRWFDWWLKGSDNGVDRDTPVRIFVMGGGDGHKTTEGRVFVGGQWRDEREWPLARAKPTSFYLHTGGRLAAAPPVQAPPTRYLFDPRDPVPTIGGNVSSEGLLMPRGAADQKCRKELWSCKDTLPLSARNDVLVFKTDPLESPMEVTGRLIVNLWVSSNAPDTDFTAKLVDVYPPNRDFPAGVDLNVADGIIRARYRESVELSKLMQPGEITKVTIEMYPTSLVFGKGHRIRLDISSSNFPRFDLNPNTGEPLNNNRRWAIAENSVYHDPQHASHIVLPVIP
ncbi:MAG TPA: CocE/NonD family hydrolase [Bryobacteraceae bacterium]|nr:CocE/NonD family hydrolase [Bryobacteraceae bacterium]